MVVDSSVFLQILFAEEGADHAVDVLLRAPTCRVATPTLLETEIVYGTRRGFNSGDVAVLVKNLNIVSEPFTFAHFLVAKEAYARFGKGRGHPARLNFGDCISYALAKVHGEPLVFKGEDFNLTDLAVLKLG
jgi:ribonuclease VapC